MWNTTMEHYHVTHYLGTNITFFHVSAATGPSSSIPVLREITPSKYKNSSNDTDGNKARQPTVSSHTSKLKDKNILNNTPNTSSQKQQPSNSSSNQAVNAPPPSSLSSSSSTSASHGHHTHKQKPSSSNATNTEKPASLLREKIGAETGGPTTSATEQSRREKLAQNSNLPKSVTQRQGNSVDRYSKLDNT